MFDDVKKQPEDIFAQTDKEAPQVKSPTPQPEAVSSDQSEIFPSSAPVITASSAAPVMATVSSESDRQTRIAALLAKQGKQGGGLKIAIIVVGLLLVIVGAFFISRRILTAKNPVIPAQTNDANQSQQSETSKPQEVAAPIIEQTPEPEGDSDQDGLTDTQEIELGTNVNSHDSDADGLFDREEVEVYFTDPLNPDSDDDGYTDGEEVSGGYNPSGSGKLLEIPSGS